jgi:hypothetical protein
VAAPWVGEYFSFGSSRRMRDVLTAPPSLRMRALLTIGAALLSGFKAFMWTLAEPKPRDFDQVWHAARALFAGRNPYLEIGPGLAFDWPVPLFYPLTAPIVAAPLALLTRPLAAIVFASLAAGAFVWSATRRSLAPAVVITSASAAMAAESVQWSPLLGAAVALPWFGVLLAAKPTIGLAIFLARPNRIAFIGGVILVALSLAIEPTWPASWLSAVRHTSVLTTGGTPYLAPVATPGGALALLALLRWRRPEARLVAALACVPQTPLLYETVPLFLVPLTLLEGGVLWVGSWTVAAVMAVAGPFGSDLARFSASRTAIGWLLYLPCAMMILRRKNEGVLPPRVDAWVARQPWPAWLRGTGAASLSDA